MSVTDALAKRLRDSHGWVVTALEAVDDAALRDRPGPHAPSIAFHAWHIARWADRLQSKLALAPELWEQGGVAHRWGMPTELGSLGTGMGLDDDASSSLPLPAKTELLAYVKAAFAAADRAVAGLEDARLEEVIADPYEQRSRIVQIVVNHTGHVSRHLGMIEALRGVRGERGTATR